MPTYLIHSSFIMSPLNRIKYSKEIEDCPMKHRLTNSAMKTNKSSSPLTSNARIIKLIQDKKYPLSIAQKSELIFPKLKEKFKKLNTHAPQKAHRYVQINLKDEDTNLFVPASQQQLWQKYEIGSKALEPSQINSNHYSNSYISLTKNQQRKEQQIGNKQNKVFCLNSCVPLSEEEQTLQTRQYRQMITQQCQKHNSFLQKIRESISSRKLNYLKNVKYSEILSEGNEKENYSFQYIVNKMEAKNRKDPNLLKKSAYESLSPNRLKDYIDILGCSKQNKKPVQDKIKDRKQINKTDQKVVNEDEDVSFLNKCSSFITQGLPSAKQRLNLRHNRMIVVQNRI